MRTEPKLHYGVAMSLDGYIAGPNGESDWITHDPEIDFAAIWSQFDTLLMGRRTYDAAKARLGESAFKGPRTYVASRTLRADDHPDITVLPELTRQDLKTLRENSRKDIWLMGGASLASTVFGLKEVDAVDLSVIPVLLGAGIPLAPALPEPARLALLHHQTYPSGIVRLEYAVQR